jgi:hypothetical protein
MKQLSPEIIDFFDRIFVFDYDQRISYEEIYSHPIIKKFIIQSDLKEVQEFYRS